MKIRATVICENCVFHRRGAVAEHGFSVLLETETGSYLLDTGEGKGVVNNALLFGLDLKALQGIILSHHHFDHTAGLFSLLDLTGPKEVFAHPDLFKESYSIAGGKPRSISLPYTRQALEGKGASFNLSADFRQIAPGFWLTGEVPRRTDYETGDPTQVVKSGGAFVPDPLQDDQSVVIETPQGLFVVLGCCHSGIINTLSHIVDRMGQSRIHTVIGGTHLGPVSENQREKSLAALRSFDIERLGVSHCTGLKTAARLSAEYGDRFFFCNVGTVVEV
jgi:7,8-dihydropterin-6-yl-methyl-4-(beta-D-ribofuranosyl)aminobenzene 5'-phosphate synthase